MYIGKNKYLDIRQLLVFCRILPECGGVFSGPGRVPASFYLASAAKLPLKCRQARVCLLRAFTSRVFSGCLFPAKCIRLCDPVFWQSKRKPKNCWHLQQNFVFCVIAITRLRTGNSFKTSSDEFTKSLIFPTAKNSTQSHIHTGYL